MALHGAPPRRIRRTVVSALAVALSASFVLSSAGIAHAIVPTDIAIQGSALQVSSGVRQAAEGGTDPGTFVSLDPARVLDTRVGNGAPQAPVVASGTIGLQVTGRGGVPETGVAAVVVNVTVTSPTRPGFITVYPSGTGMPTASNLNFAAGQTIPNLVTVKVGGDGRINLTNNSAGSAHLIADVAGYYLAGTPTVSGAFVSLDPARVLDTRAGNGAPKAPVGPSHSAEVQVTGRGGVPATGVTAVVVNVTVTAPATAGFITVFPSGTSAPAASNLNFTAGQTIPNLVTVKVGSGGKISLTNYSAGTVDLIADVAGYYIYAGAVTAPGAFVSLAPTRFLDTRAGIGTGAYPADPSSGVSLRVTGRSPVPDRHVAAVVMNVTVTNAQAPGFITVFPNGAAQPVASNLNFEAGQNIPNLTTVRVGGNGRVNLGNNAPGTTDLIADVAGYFLASPTVKDQVWPAGFIWDPCGGEDDAIYLVSTSGIMTTPYGTTTSVDNEDFSRISAMWVSQLTVTVSVLEGFELINPAPAQWVSNADGTLTGTFAFTQDPCPPSAMRMSPDPAAPHAFTPSTGSARDPLTAPSPSGESE
jgi:hypothetical protein